MKKKISVFTMVLALVCMLLGGMLVRPTMFVKADTLSIQPNETDSKDTMLRLANPTTNYGTNSSIYIGETNDAVQTYRGLIYFDLSSINSSSTINSATLYLTIYSDLATNSSTLRARPVIRTWTENGSTWNTYDGSNNWGTAGCNNSTTDYSTAAGATKSLTASETGTIAIDITDIVEWWVNGQNTNEGMILFTDLESDDAYRYHSSSAPDVANRPKIIVDYSLATNTPTVTNTSTITPTITVTPSSTVTSTATETSVPTSTNTPMNTPTLWPTATNTPSRTPTPTSTLPATFTPGGPTATASATPFSTIIWAEGLVVLGAEEQAAIEDLLLSVQPPGAASNIYAVTDVWEISESLIVVSLVNLTGISAPYSDWSSEIHGAWVGSVVVDSSSTAYAYYYSSQYDDEPSGGSSPTVRWPYEPGYGAMYGIRGVHTSWGQQSIDLIPYGGPYAYAVASGTVTWSCESGYDQTIQLSTAGGTYIYAHLLSGTTAIGQEFTSGDYIGQLESTPISSDNPCGTWSTGLHIHLGFPDVAYVQFEGCVLDVNSGYFDCNGTTIGTLGSLPVAGGYAFEYPTVGPGTEMPDDYMPVAGGEHIWDGVINGAARFIATKTSALPDHQDVGVAQAIQNGVQLAYESYVLMTALGILYIIPALLIWIFEIQMEIIRMWINGYRWAIRWIPT